MGFWNRFKKSEKSPEEKEAELQEYLGKMESKAHEVRARETIKRSKDRVTLRRRKLNARYRRQKKSRKKRSAK